MDHGGEPHGGGAGLEVEELPQMDGSCDACEPDEAQPAAQVCHTCGFAFCPTHADRHASSTHHTLAPYKHEVNGLGSRRHLRAGGGPQEEEEDDGNEAAGDAGGEKAPPGAEAGVEGEGEAEVEPGNGAEGAEGVQGAEGPVEPARRDTVTVERLRCKEHGQEGSLYCKSDEKIICVVCAVQGEHRDHEIITLHEAYVWQKSRQGYDLLGCTRQVGEKIKSKWTSNEMSADELEDYVNSQFDELRKLVRLEEKRTLHLVDLKEAFLTASAAEKIAEITLQTERLQEEMANITHQLCLLEQVEGPGVGPPAAAEALVAVPGPVYRAMHDIEARPRLPEPRADPRDPRDYGDNDSGPSMDHAP